jgi:small-conductance mechanosensitive channel
MYGFCRRPLQRLAAFSKTHKANLAIALLNHLNRSMDFNKAFELIRGKLVFWFQELIRLLPNIVLAAIILVAGLFLSKLVKRFSKKVVGRLSHGAVITNLFSSFIYIVCVGITLFACLSILQLDKAVTSILAGAGIVGLALAFAFQDIAANFMSGILITIRRPLLVGHLVKIKDYMGKVTAINLRDTVLQTFEGQLVIIPNKEVSQNPIENFSMLGRRRMDLTVGVSYGEDLEKVKQVTMDAVADIAGLAPEHPATFYYQEFSDSSINFSLRLWVASPEQPEYLRVCSEAIMRIKRAYDAAGITIPFPIRTLDFGIKGGKTLEEMVLQTTNGKAGSH